MEEAQKQKFQCKYCNKSFFNGKSLGGHMRSHLAMISAARRDKMKTDVQTGLEDGDTGLEQNPKNCFRTSAEQSNSSLNSGKSESDDQDQGELESFGLRGNPKKSLKASSDSRNLTGSRMESICKECDRSFISARALAGHKRTHSLKLRAQHPCKTCGRVFDSMRAMYGHMKSHSKRSSASSESADGFSDFDIAYPRKKRSIMRYRIGQRFSLSSTIVSDEVQNAALILMMLSRGEMTSAGFSSPVEEDVDNHTPVNLGAKTLGTTKFAVNSSVLDRNEGDDIEKQMQELDSCSSGLGNHFSIHNAYEFSDVDCEFATVLNTKADMKEPIEEPPPRGDEFQKPGHVYELDDLKNSKACESAEVELVKDGIWAVEDDQKYRELADFDQKSDGQSPDAAEKKQRVYKCGACDRIFHSHQALGGHRNRYKLVNSCCASSNAGTGQLSEYSCNGASSVLEMSKMKEHECAICFKVFPTGQALGGHKRAHYAAIKETAVEGQENNCAENACVLNFPAIGPPQVAATDDVGLKKLWWIRNGHPAADPPLL